MTLFRVISLALALCLGLQAYPALAEVSTQSNSSGDPTYQIQNPPAFAMVGDLLVARPLLLVATVIGTGLFVVALPFTALGGNVKASAQSMVVEPARATFVRCLGCTESGYHHGD